MRKRYTEQQIVGVLKASAAGTKTGELCRQYGIEEENRRLKQMVADLSLDNRALKDVLSKNF